jgi:type III secretion protein U
VNEKTEKPTPTKLRKAREEGQVAHSKDLTQTILMAALMGYMLVDASAIATRLGEMLIMPAHLMTMEFEAAFNVLLKEMARAFVALLLPFILIVIVMGLVVEMGQTGMLFAFKSLKPSGKKLNVVQNVKNMLGMKGLMEFLKSNIKIAVLSAVVYWVLSSELPTLLTLPHAGVNGVGVALVILLKSLFIQLTFAYAVIAVADFAWQRHHYMKQQMMSIDEVRREYKEQEGDPHIKQERKHLHQQMLWDGAVTGARSSSVLITNPVHLAMAIRYRPGQDPLPVLLAKGEGVLARLMVKAAREAGVPILENVPLAWDLMRRGTVAQYIPQDLIVPVAEVLRVIRGLRTDSLE